MNTQVTNERLDAFKEKLKQAVEDGYEVAQQDQIMDPNPGLLEQEPEDEGILRLEVTPDALLRLGGLGTKKLVISIDRE